MNISGRPVTNLLILLLLTGDILICGHAGSLDGLSSELQGLSPRPMTEFVGIVTKV